PSFGTMDPQHERWLVAMSKWTHPQGLAALIAGIYAMLSPIWTTHPEGNRAVYTMVGLGAVTALLALISMARPGRVALEGLIALMGVLFIISPWVMGFSTSFMA